jgi:predicted ferric reductase
VKEIPGEAFQISVTMARPWHIQPGQYIFIYIPSIGFWTSHPFTIAWYDQNESSPTEESSDINVPEKSKENTIHLADINVPQKSKETTIHLIVKRRTGFTAALHRKIQKTEVHIANVSPLLEGPYGGKQYCLDTYGTVILFAGGVGITHQLLYARHILNGLEEGVLFGRRRIQLVWAIRNFEHIEWVRSWLECLFRLDRAKNAFHVQIFITRDYNGANDTLSLGGNLRLFSGRPDVDSILRCNVDQQVGPMAVTSCGPGTMSDQVRKACIDYQFDCNIDYFEGNYCW